MTLFGCTTTKQAAICTCKANRAKLEGEPARFLEPRNTNKSVPLFPRVPSGGTIKPKKP
jgi:hypothetical protein